MFGSSKKQVIFSPSTFANNRSHRKTPSWLIIFLLGIIIGGVGLWFLQTNYGQKKLSLEESQRLQQDLLNLMQEKENLEQQLIAANHSISEARLTIQQLQPPAPASNAEAPTPSITKNEEPSDPSKTEDNPSIDNILKNIPNDPENTPIGIRVGNFTGSIGELSYDIILSKRDANDPTIPIKINLFATGHYLNGNPGFDYLAPITSTSDKYIRLQGKVNLSKPTLTPKKVEIKVINASTKKVLGKRLFTVTPQNEKDVPTHKKTTN